MHIKYKKLSFHILIYFGGITSKQQLAMFLSQILLESEDLTQLRENYCYPTFNSGCAYWSGVGVWGQNYFGRGYIIFIFNNIYFNQMNFFWNFIFFIKKS
jgi:hypothetical protein